MTRSLLLLAASAILSVSAAAANDDDLWVTYDGATGPGKGKHVVLVSGDEEYRSEETLPQLAKILAKQHGFKCTVLFAIDPKTGSINPMVNNNIPGLEALKTADLMIIFTRFRNLPDEQMKYIVDYVQSGMPVIGLRTATHAFRLSPKSSYAEWTSDSKKMDGGFGRQVLGETWVTHLVPNGKGATRGVIAKGQESHPILRGIKDGDIFGPTGIYSIKLPMRETCTPLVMGQALKGVKPTDPPDEGKYNNPMMPVAWTNIYRAPNGNAARTFTTTMGASEDMLSEGMRRLLVNATYWTLGMESQIAEHSACDLVGTFVATPYRSNGHVKNVKPSDLKMPSGN
jgi:hypothetical protein